MTLQGKLTLGSVLLATLIVTLVSAVGLGNLMELQFRNTLERAELVEAQALEAIKETLNGPKKLPMREALRDPELIARLLKLSTQSKSILEIAMVAEDTNDVIASTVGQSRVGTEAPEIPLFGPLVTQAGWPKKLWVLMRKEPPSYMLEEKMGSGGTAFFRVRVIINPTLIRFDLLPSLTQNAKIAVFSVIGAVFVTFLFSTVAFRTLGQIGRMLDLVAKGEFDPEKLLPAKGATDELSVISSKVSLLGQRLRGAQFEVSDLRGNIDHLLQDLEDAVFIFNRELRLVFASGSVERFIGRERSDLPGVLISDVFPPNTPLGLLVAQASQMGRSLRNRRVPMPSPGTPGFGPAVVLLSVDMLESLPEGPGAGSGILVRLRDPEAQRKLGHELQTADRLSAISRVSSGVAHEVKNPLNAILLHVEVAKAKLTRGDTDVGQQMEIISREILRLDRVVRTFLDFTRPVELNLANVPLMQLMREIVDLARPQAAAASIQVLVQQQSDGIEVRVDRDLLKQAVLNVVVNAMQAMPEGGALTFESSVNEDTAEIRISDTGPGIPAELRDKIFTLYFTTKNEGSGIGLAMTFRIVQLHDGTIDFTSEPGKGTTFLIRLPIAV
jgi:signal transduction histidine kinase